MNLLEQGKKKILVVAPAFVTDCLETIIEIGLEYKEMFLNKGGEDLTMVASLNDDDVWVDAIYDIVRSWKFLVAKSYGLWVGKQIIMKL